MENAILQKQLTQEVLLNLLYSKPFEWHLLTDMLLEYHPEQRSKDLQNFTAMLHALKHHKIIDFSINGNLGGTSAGEPVTARHAPVNASLTLDGVEYMRKKLNDLKINNSNSSRNPDLDSMFSNDDIQELKKEFEEVKKLIFEISVFTADELQSINNKIDFLVEFAEKEKKNHWVDLFVGTLIGNIADKTGGDTLKAIWDIVKHHFPDSYNLLS